MLAMRVTGTSGCLAICSSKGSLSSIAGVTLSGEACTVFFD
jgi:hypothetical protein